MIVMTPGQSCSPTSPVLIFVSQTVGQAVPAASLAYRILDASSPEKEANPVQVFPSSGTQPIDLVADRISINGCALDRMAPCAGFYGATWMVPSNAPRGKYVIEWTFVLTNPRSYSLTTTNTERPPSGVVQKWFEVASATSAASSLSLTAFNSPQARYSFLVDAREFLGCSPKDVSDVALDRVIRRASAMIERITGRYFEARFTTLRHNGNSSRKLLLGPPICAVSSVGLDTEPTQRGDLVVELDLLRIFNRHLAQGLIDPDDRESPKLEFVHSDDLYGIRFVPFRGISLRSLAFPVGVQNCHVRGFFGYTDPDGSPWGETPELIQHACRLICAREIHKIGSDKRQDAQWRWRVTDEKTRDNEIKMDPLPKWGEMIGDSEIDSILAGYVRPPRLGSA